MHVKRMWNGLVPLFTLKHTVQHTKYSSLLHSLPINMIIVLYRYIAILTLFWLIVQNSLIKLFVCLGNLEYFIFFSLTLHHILFFLFVLLRPLAMNARVTIRPIFPGHVLFLDLKKWFLNRPKCPGFGFCFLQSPFIVCIFVLKPCAVLLIPLPISDHYRLLPQTFWYWI